MRLVKTLALVLVLSLPTVGCSYLTGAGSVEGYEQLDEVLSEQDKARKQLFDVGSAYVVMQEILKQAVVSEQVGEDFKSAIRTVDAKATVLLEEYWAELQSGTDVPTSQLGVLLQALQQAQSLVYQYAAAQGVVESFSVPESGADLGAELLARAKKALEEGDLVTYNLLMRAYEAYLLDLKEKI